MKQLWTKVWSWYTGNTYVRHLVTTFVAAAIVHYAPVLTAWAPASEQPILQIAWTSVIAPLIRAGIKWAEAHA